MAAKLKRISNFWLVWLAFGLVASAQYRFDHWTTDQGLPQNSVYAIQQTRDGYLWLATLDGLVRFDGVRFTVFNKSTTPELTQNRFVTLLEDGNGELWAGTDESDIWRFKDGRFVLFQEQGATPFKDKMVFFRNEPDGGLLLTTGTGIFHLRHGNLQPDLSTPRETQIYYGPSGARWELNIQGALRRCKDGKTEEWKIPPPHHGPFVAPMFEDSQGQLWIGSDPALWRLKDGKLTDVAREQKLTAKTFTAIFEDREGQLWIGTRDSGLWLYRGGRFAQFTLADGLSSNNIRVIYQDREGTLWLGTDNRGLMRVNRREISSLSKAQGLANQNVYPLLQTRSGDIWIGTYPNLSLYRQGVLTNYNQSNGLPLINTESLFEDRDGTVWIGTVGSLVQYRNGRFIDLIASFGLPHHSYNLTAIHQDRSGAMWFGTSRGLVREQNGQYQVFTAANGLAGDDVKAIVEDNREDNREDEQGGLWIGTYGGLSHYRDGRFTNYTTANGLAGNRIRCLYRDASGVVWIGTYDSGLSRLKDGRVANITRRQGLANEGVFQILEDRRGYFWMSSNQGIHRVSKQQLNDCADGKLAAVNAVTYGNAEGMLNNECNGGRQPGGIKTQDGKLWFPTQDGVAIIDPEAVASNALPPPVVIETALIERQPLAHPRVLRLEPGQSNLEIDYTANSFIRPEQVKFKYQLQGLDDEWIEAGTRRTAYFSHVPPGDYVFRVIAANSDGVWNNEGASLRVIVVPPFYRRWWFMALSVVSVIGLGVLAFRYRVNQLTRAKLAQEAFSRRLIESQEHERKRIAAELHDGLGQNLLIIKNRALLGVLNANGHENAREQFNEISSSVSEAIEEVREIAYNLRPFHLDRLGLTQTIEVMLERVSAASGIEFTIEIPPLNSLFDAEAEINLYRVIQEAVNNIARHSGATQARVNILRETQCLTVTIEDNGKGISDVKLQVSEMNADVAGSKTNRADDVKEKAQNPQLHHQFSILNPPLTTLNSQSATRPSQSGGFGLMGIAERVRFLGGTHSLASVTGKGTTLTIRIPLV